MKLHYLLKKIVVNNKKQNKRKKNVRMELKTQTRKEIAMKIIIP
jgi:hypothetical protein